MPLPTVTQLYLVLRDNHEKIGHFEGMTEKRLRKLATRMCGKNLSGGYFNLLVCVSK